MTDRQDFHGNAASRGKDNRAGTGMFRGNRSSDDTLPEVYTAWHLATAARISSETALTKFDLIAF
jgi:hypothetical protein